MFASAASLWAQGQISESSLLKIEASREQSKNGEALLQTLPPPLQNSPLFQSSSFVLMSIDYYYTQPAPSSEGTQDFQTSSLVIQAVPEPSTFALGGLIAGLVVIMRVIRKSRLAVLK